MLAEAIAGWSTCVRYQVGAIITLRDRIISTGYNGSAPGAVHCRDHFAEVDDLTMALEHHEWASKYEIHAEMNALLFAAREGIAVEGATLITTMSPCLACSKAIIQAGIVKVYYKNLYSETDFGVFKNSPVQIERIEE